MAQGKAFWKLSLLAMHLQWFAPANLVCNNAAPYYYVATEARHTAKIKLSAGVAMTVCHPHLHSTNQELLGVDLR